MRMLSKTHFTYSKRIFNTALAFQRIALLLCFRYYLLALLFTSFFHVSHFFIHILIFISKDRFFVWLLHGNDHCARFHCAYAADWI